MYCSALHTGSDPSISRPPPLAGPRGLGETRGERAFSLCAPPLWNKPPLAVKMATSVSAF